MSIATANCIEKYEPRDAQSLLRKIHFSTEFHQIQIEKKLKIAHVGNVPLILEKSKEIKFLTMQLKQIDSKDKKIPLKSKNMASKVRKLLAKISST